MNKTISGLMRHILLAATLLLGATAAQADIVKYNFEVKAESGTLTGQTYTGSFSFDNTTGSGFGGDTYFSLTAFSFKFNNVVYGLGDLFSGDAVFTGSSFSGLEAYNDIFGFTPVIAGTDAYFSYDTIGLGSFSATLDTSAVPEPESLALMLGGLGLLAYTRRRNQRA